MVATYRIFDLDGTLSDPSIGIGRSLNHALQHYGHSPIAEADVSHFVGPPLDETFRSLVPDSSPDHIAALVAKYRERYAAVGYSENVVYPGIPDALEALAAADVPLGVCTSKRADFAGDILDLFGLRQYFSFVSGGDTGIRKADQLASLINDGVVARSSTMIGDRAIDIVAAKSHRLGSVAVLWGHGSIEELEAVSPDTLLRYPHELLALAHAD
jgi:phosphoglycolate phosphatase